MRSKLGIHWIPAHGRMKDVDLAREIKPTVIKLVDPDANRLAQMFDASPDSLFVLRDYPRSEQFDDVRKDPVGTGIRHAEECKRDWEKFKSVGVRLPSEKKVIWTGINEPPVWQGVEVWVNYNIAFANRLNEMGLVAGLMNLSVGHPADLVDGRPDWSKYMSLQNVLRGNYLFLHEYWSRAGCQQDWGWWAGRYTQCPFDCKIIIGECGIDLFVEDTSVGQQKRGWQAWKKPNEYMAELAEYDKRICQDNRIIGATVFTTDYGSRDWVSFDTEQIHELWKQHAATFDGGEVQPPPVIVPPVPDTKARFIFPFKNARPAITQHFGQNPQDYIKFGLKGHNGTDFACPLGTDILAVADGKVVWVDSDPNYGNYVRVYHEQYKFFSFYAHLDGARCKAGDAVKQGQVISKSGNTGNSSGPHLHLEFRLAKDANNYADFQSPFGHRAQIDPFPLLAVG